MTRTVDGSGPTREQAIQAGWEAIAKARLGWAGESATAGEPEPQDVRPDDRPSASTEANAGLFVAAPEMAEALRAAAEVLEHWLMGCDRVDEDTQVALDQIAAALGKAGLV